MSKISVKGTPVTVIAHNQQDYISLTDMVRDLPSNHVVIGNWLRRKDTIEFMGIWEQLNNPNFKLIEFDAFMQKAGFNRFALSPLQWIKQTGAIGLISKSGRYGGTYAHKDIAFEFGSWISPEFKLYLIKEFQRLKEEESQTKNIEWDFRRFLAKVNYQLHTDAVKENMIVKVNIPKDQEGYIYANEAELLNVAVFGKTSKQWREENPKAARDGKNIRDLANIVQLTVLANLESYNAILIDEGRPARERFPLLSVQAKRQLATLSQHKYTYSIDSPHSATYNISSTSPDDQKDT